MSWFNNLSRWKQDLVKKYSDKILSEDHVVPTQLRGIIPTLRNSYTKVTAIMGKDDQHSEEILETMHSGSLSTNHYGNNLFTTIGNINQLRLFTPKTNKKNSNREKKNDLIDPPTPDIFSDTNPQ